MIPILLSGTKVLGFLQETIFCTVTEERNGIYELTMQYPITGHMFPELSVDRLIKAKPNDISELQLFRIYEITKPLNGIVTVNAEHISYALSHYPVNNVSANGNPAIVIQAILDNANQNLASSHNFTVATTDMVSSKAFLYTVGSVRSALGGSEGSVLDVFGGEYEFDNYVIKLHKNRGKNTGVLVAYGKNLTDVTATTSTESSYTHLFPYCTKDDVLTTIAGKRIEVKNQSGIAQRVLIKDFSSFFESDEEITSDSLLDKANEWLQQNDINAPSINVSVSFIHLWQSPEYASVAALEKVALCDYVTVRHPQLDIDLKAQVIKTVYNVLAERYEKLELGSARSNFADTMKQATDKLSQTIRLISKFDNTSAITKAYMAAIDAATKAITGNSGGYVLLNPELNPQEILIMNTADKNTASKMWRWNLGGLGYSKNGYKGPFATAITMDGQIVADFITAGTLTANIIKAGVLSSTDGTSYFNLESGLIHTAKAEIVGGSINIGGTLYKTVIEDGSLKQYLSSAITEVGGLIPVISENNQYQAIYSSKLSSSKGVSIAKENADGFLNMMAEFTPSLAQIMPKLNILNGGIATCAAANQNVFAGITHCRYAQFATTAYKYPAYSKFGVGSASNSPSIALELAVGNTSADDITARVDIFQRMFGSKHSGTSSDPGTLSWTYYNDLDVRFGRLAGGSLSFRTFRVTDYGLDFLTNPVVVNDIYISGSRDKVNGNMSTYYSLKSILKTLGYTFG